MSAPPTSRRRHLRLTPVLGSLLALLLLVPSVGLAAGTTRSGHGLLDVELAADATSGNADSVPVDDAAVSVDGVERNRGGIRGLQLPDGAHQVCFGNLPDAVTPACQSIDVTASATTRVTATYAAAGLLEVITEPAHLHPAVTVDDVERDRAPLALTSAAGEVEVCLEELAGHVTPPCETVQMSAGETSVVTGVYEPVDNTDPEVDLLDIVNVDASTAQTGNHARNATDGELSTRWSAEGDGQWLRADLGGNAEIDHIDLSFFKGDERRASFSVQTSGDGSEWTEILPATQSSGTTRDPESYPLAGATGRFLRITGYGNTAPVGGGWNSITTLTVFGAMIDAPSTPPVEPEPETDAEVLDVNTVDASAAQAGNPPTHALDGDLDTRWSAEGDGQWLRTYLGGSADIDSVDISWFRGDARRASFSIEASDDGTDWETVLAATRSSGTTLDAERYELGDVSARFLRLVGHGNDAAGVAGAWNSVTTLTIRGSGFSADDELWTPEVPDVPEEKVRQDEGTNGTSPIEHGTDLTAADVGLTGAPLSSSGPISTSHDGQVIEDLTVSASGLGNVAIRIRHDDVIIRNVRVRHAQGANGIVFDSGASGGRVEFSLFDGMKSSHSGNFGSIGVVSYAPDTHVYRSEFQHGRDGVHIYRGDSSVVESYVRTFHRGSGFHNDGFHHRGSNSNVLFARNRVDYDGTASAGITIYPDRGPAVNVRIIDNYIHGVAGNGGFGLYGGWSHTYKTGNRDIKIEGNRFSGAFQHSNVRGDGTNAAVNLSRPGHTFTDNRWVSGGGDLAARCGISRDSC